MIPENILFATESQMYGTVCLKIVTAPSVNSFKNRPDKFWSTQELKYGK